VCPLARASAKPFLIFESSCERRISGLGLAHLLCFQDFASKISGIKDLGWYQKPKLLIPEILPRYPGVGVPPPCGPRFASLANVSSAECM
jgi:hypothetical protein